MPLPMLMGPVGGAKGYQIAKSLRFNDDDTAYLSRTPGAAGNRKTWALSVWVKRANLGATQYIWSAGAAATDYTALFFDASNKLNLIRVIASATDAQYVTTAVYRDPGAWYHIVVAHDAATTACTLYVNGAAITAFDTANAPSNINGAECNAVLHEIGRRSYTPAGTYFDGYMADLKFVDGTASAASVFGKTDALTGAWVPKTSTPAHGTTGSWVSFANGASTTTLGYDDAGGAVGAGAGSNDWTLTNFDTTDQVRDTPTNNYATLNSISGIDHDANYTYSQGMLRVVFGTANSIGYKVESTINLPASGTYYAETTLASTNYFAGSVSGPILYNKQSGTTIYLAEQNVPPLSMAIGDTATIAVNMSTGQYWTAKNAAPNTGGAPTGTFTTDNNWELGYYFGSGGTVTSTWDANFGQGGQSGLTYDAASGGAFKYTPPTGFKALCTENMPAPSIKKSSKYFRPKLYTGNGGSQSISGLEFQPDLAWLKGRSGATDHALYDSVRGMQKDIASNLTAAETNQATGLTAFNADGFSLGALAKLNTNAATYVAWCWKMGLTPGFDIVSYTGNGANRTLAHGLGVAPKLILVKDRSGANDWAVYQVANTAAPETDYLLLNSTAGTGDDNTYWNDTQPTSSVFSVGTNVDVNASGNSFVAYLFAEVPGFSKFGSYTGNGSADGPFVYTGFKPAFVLLKRTDVADSWILVDSTRQTYNVLGPYSLADSSSAEGNVSFIDFTSNGFKIRNTSNSANASSATYIYTAFAEMPFKYANAA